MRAEERRHGHYIWRDPESGQQLRVDVFGGEDFFQDLVALGFEPGVGPTPACDGPDDEPGWRPRLEAGLDDGLDRDQGELGGPIFQLRPGAGSSHPEGTSEGRAEVRRKGA